MSYHRHIDFYIPVLKVLEDLKPHEVNSLIEETADWCHLSSEDRAEMTRKGTQHKYESNIGWAITDLCQGGFIDRTGRGVYTMSFDGLLMLEDNPKNPDRDYLEARSEKFHDFRCRRRKNEEKENAGPNLFTDIVDADSEPEDTTCKPVSKIPEDKLVSDAEDMLRKYIRLRDAMLAIGTYDTSKEDQMIAMLQEGILKNSILPKVKPFVDSLEQESLTGKALIIDFLNSQGKVYLTSDNKDLAQLCSSATLIYECNSSYSSIEKKDNSKDPTKETHKNKERKNVTGKAPRKGLKVTFPDGEVIEGQYAADVFAKAIAKIGARRVMDLGLVSSGFPLVGTTPPDKYQYKEIPGGYYIPVNSPSERKKQYLEQIADALHIDLSVSIC